VLFIVCVLLSSYHFFHLVMHLNIASFSCFSSLHFWCLSFVSFVVYLYFFLIFCCIQGVFINTIGLIHYSSFLFLLIFVIRSWFYKKNLIDFMHQLLVVFSFLLAFPSCFIWFFYFKKYFYQVFYWFFQWDFLVVYKCIITIWCKLMMFQKW